MVIDQLTANWKTACFACPTESCFPKWLAFWDLGKTCARLLFSRQPDSTHSDKAFTSSYLGIGARVSVRVFGIGYGSCSQRVCHIRRRPDWSIKARITPYAYPLPRQDDFLGALDKCFVFTTLDITKWCFQQRIRPDDQWKTVFVIPYRKHKLMTVSSTGLASSSGFFQHRIDILKPYLWQHVLVYIDDIVIFSKSWEEHLTHLDSSLGFIDVKFSPGLQTWPVFSLDCHLVFLSLGSWLEIALPSLSIVHYMLSLPNMYRTYVIALMLFTV